MCQSMHRLVRAHAPEDPDARDAEARAKVWIVVTLPA